MKLGSGDFRPSTVHTDEPDGFVFVGAQGGQLRRSNFRKVWVKALAKSKITKGDVHFHDLRHTGNALAAQGGATTKELMTRMGHSTMRAALNYQHDYPRA